MDSPENSFVYPFFSSHATKRACQRRFSKNEIAYILRYARVIRKTGVRFYFLGSKDVPPADMRLPGVQRLIGATLLVGEDGPTIVTMYKNREALKEIKRKTKFRAGAYFPRG